jgi:hypothetical protein
MATIQVELERNWNTNEDRQFTIGPDVDWITANETGEFPNGQSKVTIEINVAASDNIYLRQGNVGVAATTGNWYANLLIDQDAMAKQVNFNPSSLQLKADGTSK